MKRVSAYIESLPDDQRELTEKLRDIILEEVAAVEERFSFGIPFYHYFGMFCYLHPVDEGVDLCFCRGKDLVEAFPLLERRKRAIMASLLIRNLKDIQLKEVRHTLQAAAAWNEEAKRLKIPIMRTAARKK